MAKKVQGYVKLQVPAGAANPSPPIGPALGQQGVNIMEFCKQFNAQTQKVEKGLPIPEKEVEAIMQQMREGVEKPKPKVLFEVGEMVRVKDGPFTDFQGTVEDVNYEKNRLQVAVQILGRSTPVELDFSQVEKA